MKRCESSYVRQQSIRKPTASSTLQTLSESYLSPYTASKKKVERQSGVSIVRQQNPRRPPAPKPPFTFSHTAEKKKDTTKTAIPTQRVSAQRSKLSPSNRLSNATSNLKVEDLQQEVDEARYLNKYMKTIINLNKMERLYEEEDMLSLILKMQSNEIHYLNAMLNDMSVRTDQIADKCRKTEAELDVANVYLQQMKQINEGRHLESREKLTRRVATATSEMKDRDRQIEDLKKHLLLRRHWYIRQLDSGRRGPSLAFSFLPPHEQDKLKKLHLQGADSSILKRNFPEGNESTDIQPGAKTVGFALSEIYDSDHLEENLEDALERQDQADEWPEDQRGEVNMDETADEQPREQADERQADERQADERQADERQADEPPRQQTEEGSAEQPEKRPKQQSEAELRENLVESAEGQLAEQLEGQKGECVSERREAQGEEPPVERQEKGIEGLREEQIGLRQEQIEGQEQTQEPAKEGQDPEEEKEQLESQTPQLQAEPGDPAKAPAPCFCEESGEESDSSNEKEPKVSQALEARKKKIRTCESCMMKKSSEKKKKRRKRTKSKPQKYRDKK